MIDEISMFEVSEQVYKIICLRPNNGAKRNFCYDEEDQFLFEAPDVSVNRIIRLWSRGPNLIKHPYWEACVLTRARFNMD